MNESTYEDFHETDIVCPSCGTVVPLDCESADCIEQTGQCMVCYSHPGLWGSI